MELINRAHEAVRVHRRPLLILTNNNILYFNSAACYYASLSAEQFFHFYYDRCRLFFFTNTDPTWFRAYTYTSSALVIHSVGLINLILLNTDAVVGKGYKVIATKRIHDGRKVFEILTDVSLDTYSLKKKKQ
jgi:hypothetical protein